VVVGNEVREVRRKGSGLREREENIAGQI